MHQEVGVLHPLGDALVGRQFAKRVVAQEIGQILRRDVGINGHHTPISMEFLPENSGSALQWPRRPLPVKLMRNHRFCVTPHWTAPPRMPIFRPFKSSPMTTGFARRAGGAQRRFAMTTPLMPKATAVWLVENTALSFDQIADFCKLHPLEVKAIADGDAAQGIKGLDPIQTGQLTREEIDKGVAEPDHKLKLSTPKVSLPETNRPGAKKKGPRYTPVSRRQDRPNAILWLIRN